MRQSLVSSLGLLLALGCATAESNVAVVSRGYERQPIPDQSPESVGACYEHPETQEYLEQLHARVIEAWAVAPETPPHEILARIALDPDGTVTRVRILASPDEELAARAQAAIREAQPFGSVPAAASCLVKRGLKARFATYRTGASE